MNDWRKIGSWANGPFKAVIQRSAEWQEYRVRLHGPNGLEAAADYHCDDRSEAMMTAKAMVNSRAMVLQGAQAC